MTWLDQAILILAVGALVTWGASRRCSRSAKVPLKMRAPDLPDTAGALETLGLPRALLGALQKIVDPEYKRLEPPVHAPPTDTRVLEDLCRGVVASLNAVEGVMEWSYIAVDSFNAKSDVLGAREYSIAFNVYERHHNTAMKLVTDIVVESDGAVKIGRLEPWSQQDETSISGYSHDPQYSQYDSEK